MIRMITLDVFSSRYNFYLLTVDDIQTTLIYIFSSVTELTSDEIKFSNDQTLKKSHFPHIRVETAYAGETQMLV